MKPIWWLLLGALIMFVLLKILAKTSATSFKTTERLASLVKTQQVANLVRTNEFRELVKTNEFKSFILTLADEQLGYVAQGLTNVNVKI